MKRFYWHSSGWLARVDGNPQATAESSRAHCEAEYGLIDVSVIDREDDSDPRIGTIIKPPPQPPSIPDVPNSGALMEAVFVAFGKTAARAMARQYPDVTIAIDRQRWDLVYEAVDDMLADAFITQAQHDSLLGLMSQHGVPPRAA